MRWLNGINMKNKILLPLSVGCIKIQMHRKTDLMELKDTVNRLTISFRIHALRSNCKLYTIFYREKVTEAPYVDLTLFGNTYG